MDKIDEEPKTMIVLLIEQRANSTQDVFRYDFSLIRDKLSKTQDFSKYGIRPNRQREILKRLANTKYIKIFYVDENTCQWNQDTKYINEYIAPSFSPLEHVADIFICLYIGDVESLKKEYDLGTYHVELRLSNGRFIVECEGIEYILPQLKSGRTTDILEYVWKNRGHSFSKKDLIDSGAIKTYTEDSLKKIFKGSKNLLNALKPFIKIDKNMQIENTVADIKGSELQAIIDYSEKQNNR